MSPEHSWGDDTVTLDRKAEGEEACPETQERQVSRLKLPASGPRALALGASALAVIAALLVALGGSSSRPTPIPKTPDPVAPVVEKPSIRMLQHKPLPIPKLHAQPKRTGRLGDEHGPTASTKTQILNGVQPPPESPHDASSELPAKASPEPVREAPPTPPAAEFGM